MKKKAGMCIDILMTVLLYFLMARQLTGDTAHEWLGSGMFVLWIFHHILNVRWFSHLFKGTYTPVRVFQTLINVLLLFTMIGMMVSGIILSRQIFVFLPISGGIAAARSLHVFCGFWCFVLMSLHLGLHWNMILGKMKKHWNMSKILIWRLAAAGIALYGFWAFLKNQFLLYLLRISSFAFFDFERPVVLYVTEYAAIMGLFIWIAHYGTKAVWWISKRRKKK